MPFTIGFMLYPDFEKALFVTSNVSAYTNSFYCENEISAFLKIGITL